jgi:hypothetical protein
MVLYLHDTKGGTVLRAFFPGGNIGLFPVQVAKEVLKSAQSSIAMHANKPANIT